MPAFSSRYWSSLANRGLPRLDEASRSAIEATQKVLKGIGLVWSLQDVARQLARHDAKERQVLSHLAHGRMTEMEERYATLIAFVAQHRG